jgi:hypothetical protein
LPGSAGPLYSKFLVPPLRPQRPPTFGFGCDLLNKVASDFLIIFPYCDLFTKIASDFLVTNELDILVTVFYFFRVTNITSHLMISYVVPGDRAPHRPPTFAYGYER